MTDAATAPAVDTTATVQMVPTAFKFKAEKIRDAATGDEIGKAPKLPSVSIALPVPTLRGLQVMAADPSQFAKEIDLILSCVADQVYRVARNQINDFRERSKDPVTAASLNYAGLAWTAIANMPPKERSSSVPSDEDVQAFLDSYKEVMPTALHKSADKIETHTNCFKTNFKKQRTQPELLEAFKGFLDVYLATVDEATVEDHNSVIEYYQRSLERMLKSESVVTMDDL